MSFGNEIKDFVKAFTAAQNNQSKNRYYDYMEQQARLRAKLLEKKQQEADAPMNAYREGAKNAQGLTSGLKEGRSVAYGDPVADDLQPHQKAFLNAVAAPESGGKYNVRYNGGTPATFTGDEHPNILVPTDTGEKSSAAGRYQFTGTTWDEYGGGKFDPASQDRRAWELAQDRYGTATGRPLDSDLRTKGLTPEMMQVLSPTWQGFKANPGLASDVYNDSLKRYAPPAPQAALPLPVSEQPAQYASLDDPNQEYLYEQPEYAASGGLIDRRALSIPRLPSLSANALNVGGGIGSNYRPNLPNLGRTMQAIPGVSSPAPLIRHYARGGFVDYGSDDTDDSSDDDSTEMQQASSALDTISDGYGAGDSGDDEDTPFSSVRPAVYDALHHIQNTFGLTPGAVQTNSQGFQAFASGAGAAHPEIKRDLDKALDPHDKMDDSLRNMAGLDALYKYYRDRGEIGKAQAAVASLILAAKDTAARFGGAALRAPDAKSAGKLVAEGINKTIPGVKAELDENGNYTFTDPVTGEVKESGQLSPQKLLATALGLKDGTLYWKTLSNFADPQGAQSAALRKQQAHERAITTLQTPDEEDTPATSGAPATGGAPTGPAIPATPAAGGTPAATPAADPRAPSTLSDLPDINPTPVSIPGGGKKLTPPAAAAMLGKPISVTAKMSPEKRQAYATLSASEQKVMQKDYENKLMTAANEKLSSSAPAERETNFTDREHVGKALGEAWTNFLTSKTDDNLKDTDAVEKSLPKGYPGAIKSLASHLYVNNNFTADEALEAARGLTGVKDPSSDALPFKVLKGQGAVMLGDGSTVKVPPKAVNEIVNIRKLQQAHMADQAQKKVERANSLSGRLSDAASALPGTALEADRSMGNTVGGAVTAAKDFLTTSERAREFLRRAGTIPPAYN
jgi:muramidase (phage lysozyme)